MVDELHRCERFWLMIDLLTILYFGGEKDKYHQLPWPRLPERKYINALGIACKQGY